MSNSSSQTLAPQTARKSTSRISGAASIAQNHRMIRTRVLHSEPSPPRRDPLADRSRSLVTRIQSTSHVNTQQGVGRGKSATQMRTLARLHNRRRAMRVGTLRQADRLQERENSIPLLPLSKLVKEIMHNIPGHQNLKLQAAALHALRDASEGFIINMFETCSLLVHHAGRVTLMPRDIDLTKRLWKNKPTTN